MRRPLMPALCNSMLLLLLSGCVSASGAPAAAPGVPFGEPFTLQPGASATVGPTPVLVKFDEVVSDSRCPTDVQCIQAGEGVVRVHLTIGRTRDVIDLSTAPDRGSASVGEYTVTLDRLTPVPRISRQVKRSDYRATLILRKR